MLTEFESVRFLGAKALNKTQKMTPQSGFDPELLYVECARCHRPLLWEPGQTSKLLRRANIDPGSLNSGCMILSEGCPICSVEEEGFVARLVFAIESPEMEKLLFAEGIDE